MVKLGYTTFCDFLKIIDILASLDDEKKIPPRTTDNIGKNHAGE